MRQMGLVVYMYIKHCQWWLVYSFHVEI